MPASSVKLLVMDTSPLITLAAADKLPYLLLPGLPVMIPDAVLYEATSDARRLGAQDILAWVNANSEAVSVVPTQKFMDEMTLRQVDPKRKPARDVGEQAALEVLRSTHRIGPGEKGLLLFEDSKVTSNYIIAADKERIIPITTHDFLQALEQTGHIQSADQVIAEALAAGRSIRPLRVLQDHPQSIREDVRRTLLRPGKGHKP